MHLWCKLQQTHIPACPRSLKYYFIRFSDFQSEQQVATAYVSIIKERFASDNNQTYNRFMNILQEYQSNTKEMNEVVKEVIPLSKLSLIIIR